MVFPLLQHIGKPAKPLVKKGDDVLVGQRIGEADGLISAHVISSCSGKVKAVEKRRVLTKDRNSQDRLDRILTNKWFGLPIFAVVMFLVFWISQAGPGAWIAEGYELKNGTVIPGLVTFIDWFGELH